MVVAVTYDYETGDVFQHFGRTENFKLYFVENNEVTETRVVSSNGVGHESLAYMLSDGGVDVLICGGLGGGAQAALADAGVEVFSGATGSADEAVEKLLKGELESTGVNCDHHDHEHDEGCGCGDGCGGGCGEGCGDGCGCGGCEEDFGAPFDGPNVGKTVRVHYQGTFNDGTQFDSSYDRGQPLQFVCGAGMMILGFDRAVATMKLGEVVNVHLMPEEAYGMPNPGNVMTFEQSTMPGSENLKVGQRVYLTNPYGRQFPVTVAAMDETTITFDANHEMAGKELNFKIELVEILD